MAAEPHSPEVLKSREKIAAAWGAFFAVLAVAGFARQLPIALVLVATGSALGGLFAALAFAVVASRARVARDEAEAVRAILSGVEAHHARLSREEAETVHASAAVPGGGRATEQVLPRAAGVPADVSPEEIGSDAAVSCFSEQALGEDGDQLALEDTEGAHRRTDELGDPASAYHLGGQFKEHNDLPGAEATWRDADRRGHPVGACNLGVLLQERGDLEAAEAAYRRADERGHPNGAYNLGVLLQGRGDLPEAEAAWQRADERGDTAGAYNLGVLLRERGDLEAATGAWQRAATSADHEVATLAHEALSHVTTSPSKAPSAPEQGAVANAD